MDRLGGRLWSERSLSNVSRLVREMCHLGQDPSPDVGCVIHVASLTCPIPDQIPIRPSIWPHRPNTATRHFLLFSPLYTLRLHYLVSQLLLLFLYFLFFASAFLSLGPGYLGHARCILSYWVTWGPISMKLKLGLNGLHFSDFKNFRFIDFILLCFSLRWQKFKSFFYIIILLINY